LLLVEEDWLAKHKHRFQSNLNKEGGNTSGGCGQVSGEGEVADEV
jgi:hypothetical protein